MCVCQMCSQIWLQLASNATSNGRSQPLAPPLLVHSMLGSRVSCMCCPLLDGPSQQQQLCVCCAQRLEDIHPSDLTPPTIPPTAAMWPRNHDEPCNSFTHVHTNGRDCRHHQHMKLHVPQSTPIENRHKVSQGFGGPRSSSSFSCTCICITNHLFSLTDTAASASAILLQQAQRQLSNRTALHLATSAGPENLGTL
jgi:hypothetical protein